MSTNPPCTLRNFAIAYVLAGPIYDDRWKFPTLAGSPLVVPLTFGAATEVHHNLGSRPIDGVLGLNFLPYVPFL